MVGCVERGWSAHWIYYPNSKKCWLVVKPEKEGRAKEMFAGTDINITTEGRKHLGAALGSRSYLEQYVGGKVEDWVGEVTRLAEFARSQPQASYAAFTFGLRHRWTYFMRTLPDTENLLQPLERAISDVFIPSLIGRNCSEAERDLVALPVRVGGLGFINPSDSADAQYSPSVSAPLVSKIEVQSHARMPEIPLKISRAVICIKARELRYNNFMGQGESVLCNFAEPASMPKGIENPEKEELRC